MTIKDVNVIIQGDETRTLEMKKTTGELKDGMRSACAFLNTAGGWLFFGIAPTTLKILGQEVTDNTRKEIAREIAKLEPLIDLPVEYIDVPDRPDCQVTTPQPHNPTSSPLNPTTLKDNNRTQKLKSFFSIIGENGANLKMLMEGMHLRDRKSFVNNYINPNLSEGYIAMLYPEVPNHPMQSYYLTKKGRELLEQL